MVKVEICSCFLVHVIREKKDNAMDNVDDYECIHMIMIIYDYEYVHDYERIYCDADWAFKIKSLSIS